MRICLEQLHVAYWTAFHAVLKDLNLDDWESDNKRRRID